MAFHAQSSEFNIAPLLSPTPTILQPALLCPTTPHCFACPFLPALVSPSKSCPAQMPPLSAPITDPGQSFCSVLGLCNLPESGQTNLQNSPLPMGQPGPAGRIPWRQRGQAEGHSPPWRLLAGRRASLQRGEKGLVSEQLSQVTSFLTKREHGAQAEAFRVGSVLGKQLPTRQDTQKPPYPTLQPA